MRNIKWNVRTDVNGDVRHTFTDMGFNYEIIQSPIENKVFENDWATVIIIWARFHKLTGRKPSLSAAKKMCLSHRRMRVAWRNNK